MLAQGQSLENRGGLLCRYLVYVERGTALFMGARLPVTLACA